MADTVEKTTLDNGVRVVTERIDYVRSISLGVWVATGARYEEENRRGISHFLEHMLFKGTERRPTAKHIADEMDAVGGYLNAFTDKEYTCYYARTLQEHLPLALDILADMYLHSRFDLEETEREKKVVLEEIKRRDDDPDDLVHDLFAQALWKEHPLGLPVIGTAEVVSALSPADLREYMTLRYGPDAVIVAAAGNLEHAEVVELARKTFGGMSGVSRPAEHAFPHATPDVRLLPKRTEQVNFCIGAQGYSQFDEDKYTLSIINTVVGGSMGSRLFQEIREKRGLAYSVGSYAAAFREGGMFVAYGGTSPDTYELCLDLVRQEFAAVREKGITPAEMERAKNQFRASVVFAQEDMDSRMNRLGKSEVYFNRVIPLEEVLGAINGVFHEDVLRVADRIFPADPADLTVAAVGPFKKPRASRSARPRPERATATTS
jgi:predicted Zn-dependent peptidase